MLAIIDYLRYDRPVQTLVIGTVWLILMGVAIWMVRNGRKLEPTSVGRKRTRIGYGIIAFGVLTPVLTVLIWWAFFSEGDVDPIG